MKKKMYLISCLAVLIVLGACAQVKPQEKIEVPELVVETCRAKDCFIKAANECGELEITLEEEAGQFKYSSKDCVFTKTLVKANAQETQEIKNLLEGKSFVCKYEKGKFDSRWVESLVFGMEKCEGELREALGSLLIFAQ